MITLDDYISGFNALFPELKEMAPWDITGTLPDILLRIISNLNNEFRIRDGIAVHKTAVIESNVTLKPPVIIGQNCFIGSNAYLRGGVYLGESTSIGPGCEIKSSIIFRNSALAHFNFIGDSIIGSQVNFEAGSITANHYNERENKNIYVLHKSKIISTGCTKFGSLVGDGAKIGANAVLSPGTLLLPGSIVKRLELVEQVGEIV
jgi:NDP-sugar pyrophosphorylase family protein